MIGFVEMIYQIYLEFPTPFILSGLVFWFCAIYTIYEGWLRKK